MHIIDNGVLSGFISMNRSWAGFDAEDYYRAAQIAMGLLDEELDDDLDNEFLPDGGHRLEGLIDDHGISRIARELTEAEQRVKDELEGIDRSRQELEEQAETVRTFQVVGGEMFSHIHEPVVRIGRRDILFNTSCVAKMRAEYAEVLFNPVERMLVVRPCGKNNLNAIEWGGKNRGASYLCRILYESMGWDPEYTYRIPCQPIRLTAPDDTVQQVLVFDLDNYIGRAVNKREEIIQARQAQEREEKLAEEAKSYYFPPDDEEEPEELVEMAEQVQKALELNKKIFGIPAFKHTSTFRSIDGNGTWEEWMAPARPLDTNHRYDAEIVDEMLRKIQEDPPEPQTLPEHMGDEIIEASVSDAGEEGE